MKCPDCRQQLSERPEQGVTLDVCMNCAGVWFDAGELDAVGRATAQGRGSRSEGEHEFRVIPEKAKRVCPRCVQVTISSGTLGVRSIDRCGTCRGLWVPYQPTGEGAGFGTAGTVGGSVIEGAVEGAFDLVGSALDALLDLF